MPMMLTPQRCHGQVRGREHAGLLILGERKRPVSRLRGRDGGPEAWASCVLVVRPRWLGPARFADTGLPWGCQVQYPVPCSGRRTRNACNSAHIVAVDTVARADEGIIAPVGGALNPAVKIVLCC